jgi:hypothetical protein
MLHTIFEKNWNGSYQEVKIVQLLTNDGRHTADSDGQQPTAMGHLSFEIFLPNL